MKYERTKELVVFYTRIFYRDYLFACYIARWTSTLSYVILKKEMSYTQHLVVNAY